MVIVTVSAIAATVSAGVAAAVRTKIGQSAAATVRRYLIEPRARKRSERIESATAAAVDPVLAELRELRTENTEDHDQLRASHTEIRGRVSANTDRIDQLAVSIVDLFRRRR